MIVDFENGGGYLHDWLHSIVKSVCYDREYMYAAFADAFCRLTTRIFDNGSVSETGEMVIHGIKSEYDVCLRYVLAHRLNYLGLNEVTITCDIVEKSSGLALETHNASFELSFGEKTR